MKTGHQFHAMHGFTGSAGHDVRPKIPGFKHGGMPDVEHGEHAHMHDKHPKNEGYKHGGKAHKGHKK